MSEEDNTVRDERKAKAVGREKREREGGLGFGDTAIATQLLFVEKFTSPWIICYLLLLYDIFKDF